MNLGNKLFGGDKAKRFAKLQEQVTQLYQKGDYNKAIDLSIQLRDLAYKLKGPQHLDYAVTLNLLGLLYKSTGEYEKAEPLYREVLEICEELSDPDPFLMSSVLNNLGVLYKVNKRYAEAESFYKRAIGIVRQNSGEKSDEYANCIGNLASLYEASKNFGQARTLYEQALNIAEASGKESQVLANCLNNLAGLHAKLNESDEAKRYLKRSIQVTGRTFGVQHPDYGLKLLNLADLIQHNEGEFLEAGALLGQALDILHHTVGNTHPYIQVIKENLIFTIMGLNHQITEMHNSQPEEILALALETYDLARCHLEETDPLYIYCIKNLVKVYQANDYQIAANTLLLHIDNIERGQLGNDSNPHLPAQENSKKVVNIDISRIPVSLQEPVMLALNSLIASQSEAELQEILTQYPELKSTLQDILNQIQMVQRPPLDLKLERILSQIRRASDYSDFIKLSREALQLVDPELQPDLWARLNSAIGGILFQSVSGDQAENMEQALQAFQKAVEVRPPKIPAKYWASMMSSLGLIYKNRIKGDKAENLEMAIDAYQQALWVKEHRNEPKNWASTINNLANAYGQRVKGNRAFNLERATTLFKEALQIRTRDLSPDDWATTMNNLGNAYSNRKRGDQALNLELAIDALNNALQVRTDGQMPMKWAETMVNLGNVYRKRIIGNQIENLDEAINCYRDALKLISPSQNTHTYYGVMNVLSATYYDRDLLSGPFAQYARISNGDPLLDEQLFKLKERNSDLMPLIKARQQGLDTSFDNSPNGKLGRILHSLSIFYQIDTWTEKRLYLEQNSELLRPEVDIFVKDFINKLGGDGSGETGQIQLSFVEDRELFEQCRRHGIGVAFASRIKLDQLENESRIIFNQINSISKEFANDRNLLSLIERAVAIDDEILAQIGTIGSERFISLYIEERGIYKRFQRLLSLILNQFSHSPEAVQLGANLVLRRKAIGSEILVFHRDLINKNHFAEIQPKLKELNLIRRKISQSILDKDIDGGWPVWEKNLRDLRAQRESLEIEIVQRIPELHLREKLLNTDVMSISNTLPDDTVLVEFIELNRNVDDNDVQSTRYIAVVVQSHDPENIKMVDLGPTDAIDNLISNFRSTIVGQDENRGSIFESDNESRDANFEDIYDSKKYDETKIGRALRTAVIDPLLPEPDAFRQIFIAPDGDLTRLPFEILPTDDYDRRLIDGARFVYLSAGRDILRLKDELDTYPSPSLVMADPNFDLRDEENDSPKTFFVVEDLFNLDTIGNPAYLDRPLEHPNVRFRKLKGAKVEGEQIAKLLNATLLTGNAALKSHITSCNSPHILHIATHAFFLEDIKSVWDEGPRYSRTAAHRLGKRMIPRHENPLMRGWLVLAGVNSWLNYKGVPLEAENAILTAEDAATLDLSATELVVLSACETGLGEVQIGKGVFGLRRAFVLAGARTLVMSLWKVPDAQTQELMVDFYSRILNGEGRAEALRQAQLAIKTKHPHPRYWGAFICQGNPGPISEPAKRSDRS